MSFEVSPEAYQRFMGRFSEPLAAAFADLAGLRPGQRVLDVGCGPGALTAELARRQGAALVSAVDPSQAFVTAVRERLPDVSAQRAAAEDLPFPDGAFSAALAQLVVHFMADPVAGLREMGRVTGRGGTVAACVWDHGGGQGPLSLFWRAARDLDPAAPDESGRAGAHDGDLARLFAAAGLGGIRAGALAVAVRYASFADWWQPLTLGVGPAGAYVAGLTAADRAALEEHCRELLPAGPVDVTARAWAAAGRA